ncbi:MAG TPA: hypothetical protein ENH03_05255 [Candidatus Bathyarchaeota archaeon]|nr:hypothetical protein [Candidatus Bathyarchaeota archaeon]
MVKRWKKKAEEAAEEKPSEEAKPMKPAVGTAGLTVPASIGAAGGFKLILKNVKIHAEKIRIIKSKKE